MNKSQKRVIHIIIQHIKKKYWQSIKLKIAYKDDKLMHVYNLLL